MRGYDPRKDNVISGSFKWQTFRRVFLLVFVLFIMAVILFDPREAAAHDPLADLQESVTTLFTDIEAMTARLNAIETPDLAPLHSELSSLQQQITALSASIEPPQAANVAQLKTGLAGVQNALTDAVATLQAQIEALPAGSTGTDPDVIARYALATDLELLSAKVETAQTDLVRMTYLQEQITANQSAIQELQLRPAGTDRTTAVPPLRLSGLPHGALLPHRPMFKQVNLIDVEFTIERFVEGENMALITRDEVGCDEGGQFSLYINKERRLGLRTQALGCQPQVEITSNQQLEAGTPHRVQVVNGPTRTVVFLDGVEIGSSEHVNSWDGNTLPLIFGATCWGIKKDVCINQPEKRTHKFIGDLSADIYAARKVFLIQ